MDEGREVRVEVAESLCASRFSLKRIKEVDDLPESCPEMFRGLAFDFS
jgi:hypothetical protein